MKMKFENGLLQGRNIDRCIKMHWSVDMLKTIEPWYEKNCCVHSEVKKTMAISDAPHYRLISIPFSFTD